MTGRQQMELVVEDRLVAVVVAVLDDAPTWRADAARLVALLPASTLRAAVRILAEEVALRIVAPAEDREEALRQLRASLLEAAAAAEVRRG